jgi:hypothetical protein
VKLPYDSRQVKIDKHFEPYAAYILLDERKITIVKGNGGAKILLKNCHPGTFPRTGGWI